MNKSEFEKVKDMTYLEFCDYLQSKYGIGLTDYMTKSFNKNQKCTRTKEGLIVHHKDEDKMIMLSTKEIAEQFPFEWQTKEHLVYCDMLEHLLLHVLICKYPSKDRVPGFDVGIGGASNFLIPELNDVYCGWKSNQKWQQCLHEKIINDKNVYLDIIEKYILEVLKPKKCDTRPYLFTSYNEKYGLWSKDNNEEIFFAIFLILKKHKLV